MKNVPFSDTHAVNEKWKEVGKPVTADWRKMQVVTSCWF